MAAHPFWQSHRLLRNFAGHARMLVAIGAGVAVCLIGAAARMPASGLAGWNAGVLLYLAMAAHNMAVSDEHSIRRRAAMVDESRFIVLSVAIIAVLASFAGIIIQVREMAGHGGWEKSLRGALAGLTIVLSWLLIHTIFAQHYAHEYFIGRGNEPELAPEDRAGLRFPGSRKPDYPDFLYFSFVIGVAAQTADVAITSRAMRRLNLLHCVLAFFFNTTVLALTINLAASLIADGGR